MPSVSSCPGGRLSRLEFLQSVIDYIGHLQCQLEQPEGDEESPAAIVDVAGISQLLMQMTTISNGKENVSPMSEQLQQRRCELTTR